MSSLSFAILFNEAEKILSCSKSICSVLGFSSKDLKGKKLTEVLASEEELAKVREAKSSLKKELYSLQLTLKKRDHSRLYVRGYLRTFLHKGETVYLIQAWDYTDLVNTSKLLKIFISINQIIKRVASEEELYQNICKTLIEDFGLRMAWVGIPDPQTALVSPLYVYGYEEGYLREIKITLNPEEPEGQGPTAQAIREGQIAINPDTRTNPRYEAFRLAALKRNYLSSAAIPLYVNGNLKVVLNIYASEPHFFNDELISILYEIKESLEFALENLEKNIFHHLISTALENSDLLVIVTDQDGFIKYVNHMVTLVTGYLEGELIGQSIKILDSTKNTLSLDRVINSLTPEESLSSGLFICRKKSGELFHLDLKFIHTQTLQGKANCILLGRDITLEIGLIETIENLKNFDPITGCLTLKGLMEKTKDLLPLSSLAMLVVIDLYQFTYFNDLYGFTFGDEILKAVADGLRTTTKDNAYLARAGADEFVLFYPQLPDKSSCSFIIESIQDLLRQPLYIQSQEVNLKYNLGISLYPFDGDDMEKLYRKANSATSFAKKEGPNVFKFFGEDLEIFIKKTLEAENLIEEALQKELFQFVYQPYFNMNNLNLAGAEALIRIIKPDGEIITPSKFIDVLEKSPHRKDFEIWAIKTIVDKSKSFKIPLSLNIYPETFWDQNFWEVVSPFLEDLRYPLFLEITERGFIREPLKTLSTLQKLRDKFPLLRFSLDDFGTGYNNIGYLKAFPLDVLKIDLTFIKDLKLGTKEQGIVKTIIDLAHILKAKALAEGVEEAEQLQILDIMGCDFIQGFYFSKPLQEEEFRQKFLY